MKPQSRLRVFVAAFLTTFGALVILGVSGDRGRANAANMFQTDLSSLAF